MTIDVDAELSRIKEKKRQKTAVGNGRSNESTDKPVLSWRERICDAAALQRMKFPPLKFILPSLIPEGVTLLVSRPKLGKSWLALDIAIATAAGQFTLGDLRPSPGAVLYLSLEDGKRRLQHRITKLLPTLSHTWPERLKLATEWPRADQGGLDDIEAWIVATPDARLVIVDTFALFRKPNGNTQPYADDYAAISGLQKLASKYNIGIVIVHHDRKAASDDVFDSVSGTLGLTGAADTILIMKRQAGAVGLHVRGRDIEETEKALQFNKSTCRWTMLGDPTEVFRSEERSRVIAALEQAGEALSVEEIMADAGIKSRGAADMLLGRMVRDGVLRKVRRGIYELEALDREKGPQMPEAQGGFGTSNDLTDLTQGSEDSAGAPDGALVEPAHRANPSPPSEESLCDHCGQVLRPGDNGQAWDWSGRPDGILLHERCEAPWFDSEGGRVLRRPIRTPEAALDPWRDLDIPDFLRRQSAEHRSEFAISAGPDDGLGHPGPNGERGGHGR